MRAFPLFRAGWTIDQVARRLDRAHSTVEGYLAEFVRFESIDDPAPWVDANTAHRIVEAARQVGLGKLKPIYEQLGGTVSYQHIRIVTACLQNAPEPGG
jgi:uncharacterized protein YpbB